jgi:hypothetical protein
LLQLPERSNRSVLRELAKEKGHIGATIAAEVKRGELRRFYVKQVESGPRSPFDEMSDEELDEFIRTEAADILPQLRDRAKGKLIH